MSVESRPIVVEQKLGASIDAVWRAITEKDQMCQWFFESIEEFSPERGFETRFSVDADGKTYVHLWKVTELVPGRKIVYNWKYVGYPGESFVSWELKEDGAGTLLTFSHHGIETFPQDQEVFSRKNGESGWDYFIRGRLKTFLER